MCFIILTLKWDEALPRWNLDRLIHTLLRGAAGDAVAGGRILKTPHPIVYFQIIFQTALQIADSSIVPRRNGGAQGTASHILMPPTASETGSYLFNSFLSASFLRQMASTSSPHPGGGRVVQTSVIGQGWPARLLLRK
jgi:hypothetical protein